MNETNKKNEWKKKQNVNISRLHKTSSLIRKVIICLSMQTTNENYKKDTVFFASCFAQVCLHFPSLFMANS